MVLATSTSDTTRQICSFNTDTEYADKDDWSKDEENVSRWKGFQCNAWRTELGLRGVCHLY